MTTTPEIRISHRSERIVSTLIDSILLIALGLLLDAQIIFLRTMDNMLFAVLCSTAYFVLQEGPLGKGQTIGKRIFGLRVLHRDGSLLSYGQAFKRYFFASLISMFCSLPEMSVGELQSKWSLLSTFGVAYYLLDLIVFFRDPQSRAMHDYLAQTVVLKTRGEIPTSWPASLPVPAAAFPWKRYKVGIGLIAAYFGVRVWLNFAAPVPVVEEHQRLYGRALHQAGIIVFSAKQEGPRLRLEINRVSFNPLLRRKETEIQQKAALWATHRLIDKNIINPASVKTVVYVWRGIFKSDPTAIWTVDTMTFRPYQLSLSSSPK